MRGTRLLFPIHNPFALFRVPVNFRIVLLVVVMRRRYCL